MGNLLNSIAVNAWASGNPLTTPGPEAVGLWDMITYLVKRYIVSKIENDEFLCQHLLNNGSSGTVWNMGQRAITFQPLPSRHESKEEFALQKPYEQGYEKGYEHDEPKIVEYYSSSESEESEEESEEEEENPNLALYSVYGAIHSDKPQL
uniref:Uncharacterized protein n=1 Tax=Pithovirus LCPAC304 TaxID=2506594 RepID=A0A481Z8U0_9VIRU|nr:MAG: hypothetical protein LCPAC304_01300 [Pithovirus LCPAC304]